MKVVPIFGEFRFIAYSDVYVEDADDVDRIPDLERKLGNFNPYLTSFTSGDANRVVLNSGDGQGL